MLLSFSLLLAAGLPASFSTQGFAPGSEASFRASEGAGERLTVVVEHLGDPLLRDRLVRGAEVLSDSGDLLVARADLDLVEKLRAQGVGVTVLQGAGSDRELFWIDRTKLPEIALTEAVELYARGERLLVALERDCLLDVDGHDLRASCHSGHERISETPMAPLRSLPEAEARILTESLRCVSCHTFRGVGASAAHLRARDGEKVGGFALALEDYPRQVWRRYCFEQVDVAAEIGASPVPLGADARTLFELVERERGHASTSPER